MLSIAYSNQYIWMYFSLNLWGDYDTIPYLQFNSFKILIHHSYEKMEVLYNFPLVYFPNIN